MNIHHLATVFFFILLAVPVKVSPSVLEKEYYEHQIDALVSEAELLKLELCNKEVELHTLRNTLRSEPSYVELGEFELTAYTRHEESCGKNSRGITASGDIADYKECIVAADWRIVPKNTDIYIEGLGWFTVKDKGSAIKGRRLDVLMSSVSKATEFGRQHRRVWMKTPVVK